MPVTFNEKIIAYLALISGLSISAVAVYYSVAGLTAIFAAAAIPIIIMGAVLETSKLIATVWLKQNWKIAPWSVRTYLLTAIAVLMLITSMGIFGFLSKAHSDQSLVSGDILAKLEIYDEKINTAKENIDANRKAIKQLDEAVDQTMGRSTTEAGANKAVSIRRSQQAERKRLLAEIQAEQKVISQLTEEAAPIRAEVRRVEAEVGPLKYIAQLIYGEADKTVLEKAVTWVIILIVVVFDPLAVILLLASQISFQNFRERTSLTLEEPYEKPDAWVADVGEKPTAEELAEGDSPEKESDVVSTATVTSILDQHPYLNQPFKHFENLEPMVYKPEVTEDEDWKRWVENAEIPDVERPGDYLTEENHKAQQLKDAVSRHGYSAEGNVVKVAGQNYSKDEFDRLMNTGYVQNEEQQKSGLWKSITQDEYIDTIRKRKE